MFLRLESRTKGSALLIALIVILMIAGFAAALLELSLSRSNRERRLEHHVKALYLAEAGVSHALDDINHRGSGNTYATTPFTLGEGTFTVQTTRVPGVEAVTIRSEGVCYQDSRTVEVTAVRQSSKLKLFRYGIFGVRGLHLDANAMSDSYDSSQGDWSSQAVNRIRGINYADVSGNVGTNSLNLTMDSNSGVLGSTAPGPNGVVTNNGNSFVTGARQPLLEPEFFPVVPPPDGYDGWSNPGGFPREYVNNRRNDVLPSGSYYFSKFVLDSNVRVSIQGPATVVIDTFEMNSNVSLTVDATNGPITVYSTGRFVMGNNVVLSSITKVPSDLTIFSSLDTSALTDPEVLFSIRSNSSFYGTIYAPKADVTINSNFDIHGCLVGGFIDIDSNSRVHYDTQLADRETVVWGPYVQKHWREIPGRP